MGTQFECRLLRDSAYRSALRELARVAAGDRAALRELQDRCRDLVARDSFRRWHTAADAFLYRAWVKEIDSFPTQASKAVARDIAEIVIALTAMPDYQMCYAYGDEISPNLVVIGEDYGGLYAVLANADPWFDGLFLERFPQTSVAFGVGRAMIILDRNDTARFKKTVLGVTEEQCDRARSPEACWKTRGRLLNLLETCLAQDDGRLAGSESG